MFVAYKQLVLLTGLAVCFYFVGSTVLAQQQNHNKSRITYIGQFDAGQPNASIYKVYDPSDDVVCYILMPEIFNTKKSGSTITYESNNLGSISCLKAGLPSSNQKSTQKNKSN